MARPENWRELIAVHGWGTAPARIMGRTRAVGDCTEWTGPLNGSTPQIRVSVPGRWWVESAPRVVWMFVRWPQREFVPDGFDVKRSCGNQRCLLHLVLSEHGVIVSEAARQRLSAALLRARVGAKLSPHQVKTIRRWRAEGRHLAPLVRRYGVSDGTIYSVANGFNYREPGTPRPKRHNGSGWRALNSYRFDEETCDEMLSMVAGGESYLAVAAQYDCYVSQVGSVVRSMYRPGPGGLEPEDRPIRPSRVCGDCCMMLDDCECRDETTRTP